MKILLILSDLLCQEEKAIVKVETDLLIIMLREWSIRLCIIFLFHYEEVIHIFTMPFKWIQFVTLTLRVTMMMSVLVVGAIRAR